MEEIWKDVKGYEGLYQVSNLGRVLSLNYNGTKTNRILKKRIDTNGYVQYALYKNKKRKDFFAHQLVGMAFVENPNPEVYQIINHKDEDTTNNIWTNLEWCNNEYNCNYGTRNKRIKIKNTGKKRTQKTLKKMSESRQKKTYYQYNSESELVNIYTSKSELEENGFVYKNVWACCNGNRKTHKGHKWSFNPL